MRKVKVIELENSFVIVDFETGIDLDQVNSSKELKRVIETKNYLEA